MTCQKVAGGCGYEFCWLCRGDWKQHGGHTGGYYACNKYDKDKEKFDNLDKTDNQWLEKYLFYFHRYESHKAAMKIAADQVTSSMEKGKQLQDLLGDKTNEPNSMQTDENDKMKFIVAAARQIFNNRRALQWSYVYGYFLTANKTSIVNDEAKKREMNLFEYLQEDLEKFTNYLSELLEKDLEKEFGGGHKGYEAFVKWKADMINYTRVCNKFLNNFNEGIAKGLTKV